MKTTTRLLPVALCLLLPLAAQAAPADGSISADIRKDMADARKEIRTDMAKARRELATGNLDVGGDFRFGKDGKRNAARDAALPKAEITPQGDFLIAGKAQPIDADQRRELLAYRGLVLEVATAGLDAGEKSAQMALDAVDGSWIGLMFGAMTGKLERDIKRSIKQELEPAVVGICRTLPRVMESQRHLVATLPQFRPYATLEASDIRDCERDVLTSFATL